MERCFQISSGPERLDRFGQREGWPVPMLWPLASPRGHWQAETFDPTRAGGVVGLLSPSPEPPPASPLLTGVQQPARVLKGQYQGGCR
jgi:hypothetical protein